MLVIPFGTTCVRPRRGSSFAATILLLALGVALAPDAPVLAQPRYTAGPLLTAGADRDGDGLPDAWEEQLGLDPDSASGDDGAAGDPDQDGKSNLAEFGAEEHPRGWFSRYFAEGVDTDYFRTRLTFANSSAERVPILLKFLPQDGEPGTAVIVLEPYSGASLAASDLVPAPGSFSTVVEASRPVGVSREVSWPHERAGAHSDAGASPSRTWYFAEGSTHSGFQLFFLLENPHEEAVEVTVTYGRRSPEPPYVATYTLAPRRRTTLWVNAEEPELANTEVATLWQATKPIVVERAMYQTDSHGAFTAGSVSSGAPGVAHRWYAAEGVTGPFFDTFFLLGNLGDTTSTVEARYLRNDGRTVVKQYLLAPQSRLSVWADYEDPELENAEFATTFEVLDGPGIIVERAEWWGVPVWTEGHAAMLQNAAVYEAQVPIVGGGDVQRDNYVLVGNVENRPGRVRVELVYEDLERGNPQEFDIQPWTRLTLPIPLLDPSTPDDVRGVSVTSIGPDRVSVVVEQASYNPSSTGDWVAGTSSSATLIPSVTQVDDIWIRNAPELVRVSPDPVPEAAEWIITTDVPDALACDMSQPGILRVQALPGAVGDVRVRVEMRLAGARSVMGFTVHVRPQLTFAFPFLLGSFLFPAVGDVNGDGLAEPFGSIRTGPGQFDNPSLESLGLAALRGDSGIGGIRDNRLADFNGDGRLDVITNVYVPLDDSLRGYLFFGREDGTYEEAAGYATPERRGFGETIVVADFDNDGDVDVFIPNYTDADPAQQNFLLINDGTGSFVEMADAAGVAMRGWSHDHRVEGAQGADVNDDGWIDLYTGSHLFINNGDLTFTDVREAAGLPVRFDEGMKFIDWNNDGVLDILMQDPFDGPQMYESIGTLLYARRDIFPPQALFGAYGLNSYDVDNDGWVDVLLAGGHSGPSVIHTNEQTHFSPVGFPIGDDSPGDALAVGDFNDDGLIDVVKHSTVDLFLEVALNTTAAAGRSFEVELVDALGRRNQFGRVIRVSPASRPDLRYTRVVDGGSGYLSQGQYPILVGTPYDELHHGEARFAEGVVQFDVTPGERIRVYADGRVERKAPYGARQ